MQSRLTLLTVAALFCLISPTAYSGSNLHTEMLYKDCKGYLAAKGKFGSEYSYQANLDRASCLQYVVAIADLSSTLCKVLESHDSETAVEIRGSIGGITYGEDLDTIIRTFVETAAETPYAWDLGPDKMVVNAIQRHWKC